MLKKNHRGELVAVSEVVKNIKRNSISYQTYRDFAENKGEFRPGA